MSLSSFHYTIANLVTADCITLNEAIESPNTVYGTFTASFGGDPLI